MMPVRKVKVAIEENFFAAGEWSGFLHGSCLGEVFSCHAFLIFCFLLRIRDMDARQVWASAFGPIKPVG